MNHDPEKLPVAGHAYGNLTPPEEQELYGAALEDQAVFDALMEEERLRQVLAKPGVRRELLDALRAADASVWDRMFAFFRQPMGLALAGSLAAVAFFIGFFGLGGRQGGKDAVVMPGPELAHVVVPDDVERVGALLFRLPAEGVTKSLTGPSLTLGKARYRIGDAIGFTVRAAPGLRIYVVEQWADGTLVKRYPEAAQGDGLVGPSGEVVVQARQNIAGPVGARRLRLAVLPEGLGVDELNDGNAGRVTVVETPYEVEQ